MNYLYSDILKIPSEISDHDASVAFLRCPKSVAGSFKREVWLYDKVDKHKFIEKLLVDWITLLCDDVDDMCNQFTKTFLELARECIPTKTVILDIMTNRVSYSYTNSIGRTIFNYKEALQYSNI
jgi:hypothetical protein